MTCFALREWMAVLLLAWASATPAGPLPAAGTILEVPVVRQAPERCGQAALEMVLRFYGADAASLREGERAYDPALRGSLITDLAAAARRAGYEAEIATLAPDSLIALGRSVSVSPGAIGTGDSPGRRMNPTLECNCPTTTPASLISSATAASGICSMPIPGR